MTPRRIASQRRTQVPHSATGDSRKDALWGCHSHGKPHSAPATPPRRDQGRILDGRRHGKAHFAVLLAYYMPVAKAAEMAATLVGAGVQELASRQKASARPRLHARAHERAGPHARRVLWVLCTLCHLCVLCTLCLRPERHTAFRLGDGEVMCRAVSEPV